MNSKTTWNSRSLLIQSRVLILDVSFLMVLCAPCVLLLFWGNLSDGVYSIYVTRPKVLSDFQAFPTPSIAADLSRWKSQGRSLVNTRVREPANFTPLNQEVADSLTQELERIREAAKWVTLATGHREERKLKPMGACAAFQKGVLGFYQHSCW